MSLAPGARRLTLPPVSPSATVGRRNSSASHRPPPRMSPPSPPAGPLLPTCLLAANGFGGPRARSFLWPSAFVAPSLALRLEPCAKPALQGSDAARDADGKHEEEPDLAELCEHLSVAERDGG